MSLRVAVLGAGASGLAAIKCCIEEGLEPVCYERSSYIGGLWHFARDEVSDTARVMADTIANTSKEVLSFSDFPPPKEYPIYMHNTMVDQYLNMYADKFHLRKHIRLNHEVLQVSESPDHDVTGRWTVTVKDKEGGTTETQTFDGVLVCTGPFRIPVRPKFEGLDSFQGKVMYANQYTDSTEFKGKRVVVVGFGNSAGDIATDLCHSASQVYISTRHGGWVISRVSDNGDPVDFSLSRFLSFIAPRFPGVLDKIVVKRLNARINHQTYGICPKETPLRSNLFTADYLPIRLITGAVKMKPGVARFRSHGVEFSDGSDVSDIDAVIIATGYRAEYPFLESSVVGEDKTMLYKAMYPPDRTHNTLAIMYCLRLRGPVFPITEMQARVATRVLKGLIKLPPKQDMLKSIATRNAKNAENRNPRMLDIIQIDYYPYMDELADMVGCKPDIWGLLFSDRKLAMKCLFGPAVAYQYRLQGPGSWSGARETVMTVRDRTYYPLTDGKMSTRSKEKSTSWTAIVIMIAIFISFWMLVSVCFSS